MGKHGCFIICFNGSETRIRYHYIFQNGGLRVTFDGRDLADLLDVTQKRTLRDIRFEACMEIQGKDGRIEEINVRLPEIIMNSTATELRENHSLYRRPYYV